MKNHTLLQIAACFYASAFAVETSEDCSIVCLELCKSHSDHYPRIEVCNNHCCPQTIQPTPVNEPTQEIEQNASENALPNDVHGGPKRDPNCNLEMFNGCNETYQVDYNYYNRWACVVASGCVSWTTFSLHNK